VLAARATMQWPPDLERLVVARALSHETRELATAFARACVPTQDGSVQRPFFAAGAAEARAPPRRVRACAHALPAWLLPTYERYDTDVEFRVGDLVFLSEDDSRLCSREHPRGVVDMAYRYRGMGHVDVIAYDAARHAVHVGVDGGANGHDRVANAAARRAALASADAAWVDADAWVRDHVGAPAA